MDAGAWWGTVHGVARLGHNLATETNTQYRLDTIQERISELWDISIETSKTEKKKKLKKIKSKNCRKPKVVMYAE